MYQIILSLILGAIFGWTLGSYFDGVVDEFFNPLEDED